jgi:uncharacterized OB-fold protein
VTNIDADPGDVEVGTRVEVTFAGTGADGVAIPLFEPVED